jgi:hypothetical protein
MQPSKRASAADWESLTTNHPVLKWATPIDGVFVSADGLNTINTWEFVTCAVMCSLTAPALGAISPPASLDGPILGPWTAIKSMPLRRRSGAASRI